MFSRITPHFLSLALLLYFWAAGLTNLDRFPKIHEDESWQAAPGYTFWTEGRFGTNLFAGFYGMERHYYGFMPLFPLLVGGALHLFGLGLFQARLVPLALLLLTLALTHRLGVKLFSPWHGTIAIAILVTWRIAGPFPHLVSGVPLADVARITRYDSAVPVFGLAALLLLVTALKPTGDRRRSSSEGVCDPRPETGIVLAPRGSMTPDRRPATGVIHHSPFTIHHSQFLGIGFFAGLAALSHVYGAFWLPALFLTTFWILGWRAVKPTILAAVGFGLTLAPWLIFVASGWADFLAQTRNYADRFSVWDVRFYLINLLNEVERYDPILNGAKQSLGAWLWLILCSLSLIWLLVRSTFNVQRSIVNGQQSMSNSQRSPISNPQSAIRNPQSAIPGLRSPVISAQIIVAVLLTLGVLFALLLSFKTFSYLATLWPLFALAMAAGLRRVWEAETSHRWWRPALLFFFLLAMSEGVYFQARLQTAVQPMTSYQTFTQAIAAKLPPGSRIMGLQHYWLGLAEHSQDYRSILVPIYWTDSRYVPQPISFGQATQAIPPNIVLLDQIMLDFLAETVPPDQSLHPLGQEIWAYLKQHQAQRIDQLDDPTYGRIQIYQLK